MGTEHVSKHACDDQVVHIWCTLGARPLRMIQGLSRNPAAAQTDKNRNCRCLGTMRPRNFLRNRPVNQRGYESLPLRFILQADHKLLKLSHLRKFLDC